MPTFSRNLEQSLHRALAAANERRHEYATLEHLLLSLLDDGDAALEGVAAGGERHAVHGRCRADLGQAGEGVAAAEAEAAGEALAEYAARLASEE